MQRPASIRHLWHMTGQTPCCISGAALDAWDVGDMPGKLPGKLLGVGSSVHTGVPKAGVDGSCWEMMEDIQAARLAMRSLPSQQVMQAAA
jgi:hypothetical protein